MDETNRRREKQLAFNAQHHITPQTVTKTRDQVMAQGSVLDVKGYDPSRPYSIAADEDMIPTAAEEQETYSSIPN